MVSATWQVILAQGRRILTGGLSLAGQALVLLLTFTYHPRFLQYTVEPLRAIIASRDDASKLKEAVLVFRERKRDELRHVKVASTISAAATIGVFAWPDVATTYWAARALWYSAMVLSFFSLISSSQSRLLDAMPKLDDKDTPDDQVLLAATIAIWKWPACPGKGRFSWGNIAMIHLWQSMTLQMSWAWAFFLVGLLLHVLRVFLPKHTPNADEKIAIFFVTFAGLATINTFATAMLMRRAIRPAQNHGQGGQGETVPDACSKV